MENKDKLPNKIDTAKRDSLKKIATATAWAIPTIATFSLDSVRNVAHAQESSTAPEVTTFAVTQTTYLRGDCGISKPMDTSKTCYEWTFNPGLTVPLASNNHALYSDGSNAYIVLSLVTSYTGTVTLQINQATMGCAGSELLVDLYGNQLAPWMDSVVLS